MVLFPVTERHHAASSRTLPSQHESHASQGISLHSSQQLPHPHHHHHSGPHGHQRRDRGSRLNPDDARSYMSHSQHRSPSHSVHSPKRSSRYHASQGETRANPGEPFQHSPHMYQRRRGSSEDSPDLRKVADPNSEKHRVSAETALARAHDRDPQAHRGHHIRMDSASKSKGKATCKFVETRTSSEDLEAGSSQDTINPADIKITLENEAGEKIKSSSSGSTLIEDESPPPQGIKRVGSKQYMSQELFGDEDSRDMMSMSELPPGPAAPIPLSNFPHYYESSNGYFGDHQQEGYQPPHHSSSTHEQLAPAHCHGLSQPSSFPSPPKSRYGKSLTDLTGSNVSLTSSQPYLSQSTADIHHFHDLYRHPDTSRQQRSEGRRKHEQRFRVPHGQLQRMSSDSHLNKPHTPGLQMSIISALSDVTEEQEQRRQQTDRGKRGPAHAASQQTSHRHAAQKSSQLQQRHLKATVVVGKEESSKKNGSPHKKRLDHLQEPAIQS